MDLEALYKRWVATGVGSTWAKAGRSFVDFTKTAPLTPQAMDEAASTAFRDARSQPTPVAEPEPEPEPEPKPEPKKKPKLFRRK